MKTFVEPDSKQLEQCIFLRMFIRDGPLSFREDGEGRGGGWEGWEFPEKRCAAKTENKNRAMDSWGKTSSECLRHH